jgi:hypothetical protein
MRRFPTCAVAPLLAALLLAGCSKGHTAAGGFASTTVTTGAFDSTSTTTTLTSRESTTTPSSRPGATTTAVTTAPSRATTTTAVAGAPAVVSAGGWRMVISQPLAGATVGSNPLLCYEVTGSSREPALAFDVTLLRAGSPTGAAGPYRIDVTVGRGSARLSLDGVAPGRYDIRVQLISSGSAVDGGAVTIPSVTVSTSQTGTASCL